MYGLNAFALILFVAINVFAAWLSKAPEPVRNRVIRFFCLILLLLNIGRYTLSPLLGHGVILPVEFSTVANFAVPLILLTSGRRLQSWAAYSGLMAGFFYYAAMIAAGGPIYHAYPHNVIYMSMFCHGTLYLCGFVTIGARRYPERDEFLLLGGIACVAAQALVLRPLAETERMLIYELLDGAYIRQFLPQQAWRLALPVYYVVLAGLLLLSVKGFFALNRSMYQKYSSAGERCAAAFPSVSSEPLKEVLL